MIKGFENERLMMSKEEARNRAKELLNENQELKEQQEEFIKYLEDEIKFYKNRDIYMIVDMFGSYDLNDIKLKLLEEILSKYKENNRR